MLELFCFQAKNVWSTPPQNESKFNQVGGDQTLDCLPGLHSVLLQAYAESRNVLLIYSVKVLRNWILAILLLCHCHYYYIQESGKFCGVARLSTESRRDGPKVGVVFKMSSLIWVLHQKFPTYTFFRFRGFSLPACLPRPLAVSSTLTGSAGGISASRKFSTCTTPGMRANLSRLDEMDRFLRNFWPFYVFHAWFFRRSNLKLLKSFADCSQR